MIRDVLATTFWLGALAVCFGHSTEQLTFMGLGGILASASAVGWGLTHALTDRPDDMTEYRENVWARRDMESEEDELPWMPPTDRRT